MENIIGVNFGTKSINISKLNNNLLELIFIDGFGRKFSNIISFYDEEIFYGLQSELNIKKNSINTINNYLIMLKMTKNNMKFDNERLYINTDFQFDDQTYFLYKIKSNNKDILFYPEQILLTMLNIINDILKSNEIINYTNIGISIPEYLNQNQINLFNNILKISNISNYVLIKESRCLALHYKFIYENDINNNSKNIIFIDFGYTKLSIFICNFKENNIKFINLKHDNNCGVRNIDNCILDLCIKKLENNKDFQEIIKKKQMKNIIKNKKLKIKLLKLIESKKKILNESNQIKIKIEDFVEDFDFEYILTTQKFLKKINNLKEKIKKIILDFKREIREVDIDSIEILGGGCKIPFFKELLKDIFSENIPILQSLDSNESISYGASLYFLENYKIESKNISNFDQTMPKCLTDEFLKIEKDIKDKKESILKINKLKSDLEFQIIQLKNLYKLHKNNNIFKEINLEVKVEIKILKEKYLNNPNIIIKDLEIKISKLDLYIININNKYNNIVNKNI